jgi:DNA (cytosine-5)-methyltransferase 1
MHVKNSIQVVDLFAGPGGLGEGFSSLGDAFKILVSAEMDPIACKTLRLRSFFRTLNREFPEGLDDYYRFCNDKSVTTAWSKNTEKYWKIAEKETLQITLGSKDGNEKLDEVLNNTLDHSKPWVLIGGPPCQAYSLAGKARHKSGNYIAEEDHRNFLYKEYLRIIQQYKPSIFVMENVKGMLSAQVGGKRIFHDVLHDLSDPDNALTTETNGEKYVICSLSTDEVFHHGDDPKKIDASKFIIRAEKYGIPQARHRVILLGIKESLFRTRPATLTEQESVSVASVISDLPELRSKFSKQTDDAKDWLRTIKSHIDELAHSACKLNEKGHLNSKLLSALQDARHSLVLREYTGELRAPKQMQQMNSHPLLNAWYWDNKLSVHLNHESRGHITGDLRRYVYAASFAKAYDYSPKGHKEFALSGLRPEHQNWESGKFADRFRVQLATKPATTVTCHIAKDGHYFIHPDPTQCRSLTVREAARLQTFPDNYFFQGNRTQQYHQVGNAVPPLLAKGIAQIVSDFVQKYS